MSLNQEFIPKAVSSASQINESPYTKVFRDEKAKTKFFNWKVFILFSSRKLETGNEERSESKERQKRIHLLVSKLLQFI